MLQLHLHSYGQFDSLTPIGPSIWPHFDLLYFHEGSARLEIEPGQVETFEAGQGLLLFPQTRFAGTAQSDSVLASVQHFSLPAPGADRATLPWPLVRLEGRQKGFIPLRGHARSQIEQDINRAMRLATEAETSSNRLIRESFLLIILAQLFADPSPVERYSAEERGFGPLLRWAQANFHTGISVKTLADLAHLSESHFRARFAAEIGQPAGRYLLRLRLNEAKRLLRETRQPIKAIAQALGYSDVVAFHRAFKNQEKLTPTDYRIRYAPRG